MFHKSASRSINVNITVPFLSLNIRIVWLRSLYLQCDDKDTQLIDCINHFYIITS